MNIYKKTFFILVLALFCVSPLFAEAQLNSLGTSFGASGCFGGGVSFGGGIVGVLCTIGDILSYIIPLLITLGLIYFLWGVAKYVASGDDEAGRDAGRQMIVNGIIALFVMISIWGLVGVLVDTFSVSETAVPLVPEIVR